VSSTLTHPFRITAQRRAATMPLGGAAHAAQLAGHVLSTTPGERGLAPEFGLPDPTGGQIDPAQIAAALTLCAPELDVEALTVTQTADGQVDVTVTVDWDLGED
jgi:phage baseplate assembly protein W